MDTHADRTQENKNESLANGESLIQSGRESAFPFVDNRPEAIAQREVQAMANNSAQVKQLRAYQEMAIGSSSTMPIQMSPFSAADIAKELNSDKVKYGLDGLSTTDIRQYTREFTNNAPYQNPNLQKAAKTVASRMKRKYLTDDSGGSSHVPHNKDTTHTVNGVNYKFHNDAGGYLDFLNPCAGYPAVPVAGGTWDVNIENAPAYPGTLKHTGGLLKNSRPNHFKVSNIIREGGVNPPAAGNASPNANFTWHHHEDVGRMQLIDRYVHAAFSHKGGFAKWGS